VGSLVGVYGAGFAPNRYVALYLSGANYSRVVAVAKTSAIGVFITRFQVPQVTPGPYVVTAIDATGRRARQNFRVLALTIAARR